MDSPTYGWAFLYNLYKNHNYNNTKGYVAKVVKKDSVRGGSARPAFVHQHQQFQNHDSGGNGGSYVCCWHFCTWLQQQQQQQHLTNTNNENENSNKNAVRVPEYQYTKTINNNNNFLDVGTSSSFSSTVDNDTPPYTSSSSSTNSSPFLKRSSSMITYGKKKESHFALKSILLDRCSTPEFMEELKNEGTNSRITEGMKWKHVCLID